jgi:flagellar basal-body rod protein FlgG
MKIVRKMLIGGLSAMGIVMGIAGATLYLEHKVFLTHRDSVDGRAPVWDARGDTFDYNFPANEESLPGVACVVDPGRASQAQAVIDDELRDASPEEREIWRDELAEHSPEEVREILGLHRRLSPPRDLAVPGEVQLASADAPQPLPETVTTAGRVSVDALGLIESGIDALHSAEQVILNNVANANTVGFKRSRALFTDLSYRQVALPGALDQAGHPSGAGIALGSGAKLSATQSDVSQGRLRHTKQPLDLAIQGEGYFQIKDGDRFFYTRVGAFTVNAEGQIVLVSNDRGRPLEPAITVPQDTVKIMISHEGIVSTLQTGQSQFYKIGQIQLARFTSAQGLVARGESLFEQTEASGVALVSWPGQDALGEIRQGYLEESNVDISQEQSELRRLKEQLKALQQLHAEYAGTPKAP